MSYLPPAGILYSDFNPSSGNQHHHTAEEQSDSTTNIPSHPHTHTLDNNPFLYDPNLAVRPQSNPSMFNVPFTNAYPVTQPVNTNLDQQANPGFTSASSVLDYTNQPQLLSSAPPNTNPSLPNQADRMSYDDHPYATSGYNESSRGGSHASGQPLRSQTFSRSRIYQSDPYDTTSRRNGGGESSSHREKLSSTSDPWHQDLYNPSGARHQMYWNQVEPGSSKTQAENSPPTSSQHAPHPSGSQYQGNDAMNSFPVIPLEYAQSFPPSNVPPSATNIPLHKSGSHCQPSDQFSPLNASHGSHVFDFESNSAHLSSGHEFDKSQLRTSALSSLFDIQSNRFDHPYVLDPAYHLFDLPPVHRVIGAQTPPLSSGAYDSRNDSRNNEHGSSSGFHSMNPSSPPIATNQTQVSRLQSPIAMSPTLNGMNLTLDEQNRLTPIEEGESVRMERPRLRAFLTRYNMNTTIKTRQSIMEEVLQALGYNTVAKTSGTLCVNQNHTMMVYTHTTDEKKRIVMCQTQRCDKNSWAFWREGAIEQFWAASKGNRFTLRQVDEAMFKYWTGQWEPSGPIIPRSVSTYRFTLPSESKEQEIISATLGKTC
ncbi:hypothetical protein BCR39DRAFT_540813 [Naematelia encephala]|uniref:Uncharacterized protein n=1 Tax=Naematelia encephala TaxID=71784 RepID=A0A1Y2AV66_9TREE|nr:hypothetical protein BCR39DRAFT_540813 [Naematelia encephala]